MPLGQLTKLYYCKIKLQKKTDQANAYAYGVNFIRATRLDIRIGTYIILNRYGPIDELG